MGILFFLFGSMLNGENEEKRRLEFYFTLFFPHVGSLAGVYIFYIKKHISQECMKTQIFLGIKLLI